MAIIKCKMCGGDMEISADKTFGVCEYCGSTMTLPKVDSEQRAAIFNRGNHFRRICEFDKALAVYERIVAEDDTDAEAHWCCALCRFGIEYVEDPATMEWLPTCHRASFDSFLEDVDYLAAVEHSDGLTRRQYQKDAAKIAEVQRGILATSQTADPFDVFICYKETDEQGQRTRDSMLAQDIYYQLTEEGYRVFFSRITLEDVAGTQYEPYIFAALNSAKVMVAVGTKAERLNAVWVKNEWSRFLALMKKDRSKLLLPCYRDMDPYDLPEQLGVLQSYDMSKIGFIQDLIRGISKVLDASKKEPEPVRTETVVVQQPTNSSADALVDRGFMSLEDVEWEKADHFFEESLNQNAKNSRAYLGKYLASRRQPTLERVIEATRKRVEQDCAKKKTSLSVDCIDSMREAELVQRYIYPPWLQEYDPRIKSLWQFDNTFQSSVATAQEYVEDTKRWLAEERNLNRALQYADPEQKQELESFKQRVLQDVLQLYEKAKKEDDAAPEKIRQAYEEHLKQAEEKLRQLREQTEHKLEADYQRWAEIVKTATDINQLTVTSDNLTQLGRYKDSSKLVELCGVRMKEILEKEAAQAERRRIAWEKERKARATKSRRIGFATCGLAALLIAVGFLITQIIIPNNRYKEAEKLLEDGRILDAAMAFNAVGDYKDSKARSFELWGIITKRETISTGNRHTVGLKNDGTVVAVGLNSSGQCNVNTWTDIAAVSAADYHTIGLKRDGTVVAVGANNAGQCNVGEWKNIVSVDTGVYQTVGLRVNGTVAITGFEDNQNYTYMRSAANSWTDIVAVSAGGYHTVGLRSDGTVVAVGLNGEGQCDVTNWSDIVAISAGYEDTMGLKADGTVVVTGLNNADWRNVNEWENIVDVAADSFHAVGVKANGLVVAVGDKYGNEYNQCDVNEWENVVSVTIGHGHTVALKSDGTAIAIGKNDYGQCDVGKWSGIKQP